MSSLHFDSLRPGTGVVSGGVSKVGYVAVSTEHARSEITRVAQEAVAKALSLGYEPAGVAAIDWSRLDALPDGAVIYGDSQGADFVLPFLEDAIGQSPLPPELAAYAGRTHYTDGVKNKLGWLPFVPDRVSSYVCNYNVMRDDGTVEQDVRFQQRDGWTPKRETLKDRTCAGFKTVNKYRQSGYELVYGPEHVGWSRRRIGALGPELAPAQGGVSLRR
ncbi:MAG: hypothetical protein AAF658_01570 [Myxococcota bacterium]